MQYLEKDMKQKGVENNTMDKIHIENLEIYAYHGVNPEETSLGQKFILTLDLYGDFESAGKTDDLTKTVHYGDVCHFAEKLFLEKNHLLIEACANCLAEGILNTFPMLKKIRLQLKKPWAPIGSHLEYASVEIEREWKRVYIGVGSNMGDKLHNIETAIAAMNDAQNRVTQISKHYVTRPWGYENQDEFLNCAVELMTILSPMALLRRLQEIENSLDRKRSIKWGPRTIDLDILLYEHMITDDKDLIIPHPYLEKRMFVLTPLSDIAPHVIHPLLGKRISRLKEDCARKERRKKLTEDETAIIQEEGV